MRLAIDNNDLIDDFFSDVSIMGIVAPVKDYRFCWMVNQSLGCDFRLNQDIEIQLAKKGRQYYFPIYEYCEPGGSLVHYIYSNHFDGEYLLPEFRNFDFLWVLKGDEVRAEYLQYLQTTIRNIADVQLVSAIDANSIRNKMHMVF